MGIFATFMPTRSRFGRQSRRSWHDTVALLRSPHHDIAVRVERQTATSTPHPELPVQRGLSVGRRWGRHPLAKTRSVASARECARQQCQGWLPRPRHPCRVSPSAHSRRLTTQGYPYGINRVGGRGESTRTANPKISGYTVEGERWRGREDPRCLIWVWEGRAPLPPSPTA